MRYSRPLIGRFFKFVAVGALVGIVFSILVIALPMAGVLFILSAFDIGWTLPWVPSMPQIMAIGAIAGAAFAAALFIKDRYVPYVEEVPDFEGDDDDPGSDHRLH
ncbi:hypothetical protein [Sneathiella sp. HT1-7]|uniref:hypothetical protein n=1 Tax=Sneathiella sp. HT1-7 TaxID=2887192 RepID=UPI001D1549AD|nr:hypothetical protein [Sneathiella sp. HT1-7]MCC3303305.1 hypothetical protein [Sneathiella sp. HT1-7]